MEHQQPAHAARRSQPRLLGIALALALALTPGTMATKALPLRATQPGAPAVAQAAPVEPLPAHLDCWITGVDDEGMSVYGIGPLPESRCPSGRALDLRVLRDRLGLP